MIINMGEALGHAPRMRSAKQSKSATLSIDEAPGKRRGRRGFRHRVHIEMRIVWRVRTKQGIFFIRVCEWLLPRRALPAEGHSFLRNVTCRKRARGWRTSPGLRQRGSAINPFTKAKQAPSKTMANGKPVDTAMACNAARPPPSSRAMATSPSKVAQKTR